MTPEPDRRSILGWATIGLGAIFSAILGIPAVCFFLDPWNRKAPASNLKLVNGVKLDELNGNAPKQGIVRDTRTDGWTLYPNDVIGRVWVVQRGARPDLSTPEKVEDFNKKSLIDKEKYLNVFTTVCPHLGCSVNLNDVGDGFACPCHAATFKLDGLRASETSPANRGMDTLDWEIDLKDPNRINVKFQKFVASIAAKTPI